MALCSPPAASFPAGGEPSRLSSSVPGSSRKVRPHLVAAIMCVRDERRALRTLRLHMHQPTQRLVCSHLVRVPTPTSFGDGRSSLERWFHSKVLPLSPSSACSSSTTCRRSSSWDGDDGLRHLKQRQVRSRGLSSTPALEHMPSCPHPPPVSRTPPPPVSLPAHLLALNGTLTLLCAVVEGISLRRRRP